MSAYAPRHQARRQRLTWTSARQLWLILALLSLAVAFSTAAILLMTGATQ
jgi:hypothetical protein